MVGLNSKLDTDEESRGELEGKSEELSRRQHRDNTMENMERRLLQDPENKIKAQHTGYYQLEFPQIQEV